MVLSKLDLALLGVLVAGLLWIEHDHRMMIAPSTAAAASAPTAASVCPDTDDAPFSADCLKFIDGNVVSDFHARMRMAASVSAAPAGMDRRAAPRDPACPPSNENEPYSARCLRFLSGNFWHP